MPKRKGKVGHGQALEGIRRGKLICKYWATCILCLTLEQCRRQLFSSLSKWCTGLYKLSLPQRTQLLRQCPSGVTGWCQCQTLQSLQLRRRTKDGGPEGRGKVGHTQVLEAIHRGRKRCKYTGTCIVCLTLAKGDNLLMGHKNTSRNQSQTMQAEARHPLYLKAEFSFRFPSRHPEVGLEDHEKIEIFHSPPWIWHLGQKGPGHCRQNLLLAAHKEAPTSRREYPSHVDTESSILFSLPCPTYCTRAINIRQTFSNARGCRFCWYQGGGQKKIQSLRWVGFTIRLIEAIVLHQIHRLHRWQVTKGSTHCEQSTRS